MIISHALAHEDLTDGPISVFIHIAPDDDPVINQKAEIHIFINDKDHQFNEKNCDCIVRIGTDQFTFKETIPYTFSHKGNYPIVVSGTPKTEQLFHAFKVSDEISVTREVARSIPVLTIWWFIIPIAIIVGLTALAKKRDSKYNAPN